MTSNIIKDFIREDGYINATLLCKYGEKEFKHWNSLETTKKLIIYCEKYTNIEKNNLIIIKKGRYGGSWMHPILATNLAQWISIEFSIKVSIWIDEWKQINNNKSIYNNEIINLVPDYTLQKEREIQLKLHKELGGKIEVETDSGFIDILTDNEIIEIKNGKNWKDAVGQILIYSLDYPKHVKRIHLFDIDENEDIQKKCEIYNILVTYEKIL
jgi:hypothetical protein